jgi:hypothetical protein
VLLASGGQLSGSSGGIGTRRSGLWAPDDRTNVAALGEDGESNDRLFVAGEEHHTIEVFKAGTGKHLKSVGAVKTPHALAYVAGMNELVVACGGDSSALFLDANDLHRVDRIAIIDGSVTGKTDSPDTGFYDAKRRTFFIGNGCKSVNLPHSEITAVNVDTHKVTARVRVGGDNLEAIATYETHDRIFIDVRDKKQVAIVDLKQIKLVETWNLGVNRNIALGFDPANNLVFAGNRAPGLLTLLDGKTGDCRRASSPRGHDGFAILECHDQADLYRGFPRPVSLSSGEPWAVHRAAARPHPMAARPR